MQGVPGFATFVRRVQRLNLNRMNVRVIYFPQRYLCKIQYHIITPVGHMAQQLSLHGKEETLGSSSCQDIFLSCDMVWLNGLMARAIRFKRCVVC